MSIATDLHEQMMDAVRGRDLAALRSLYHRDYTYMSGDGQEQKGAEAGVAVVETYTAAFPDLSFDIRHRFGCGEDVSVIEFTARGTHQGQLQGIAATGRQVGVVVCNVIEVRDGKIYREREYSDSMAMLDQLGMTPGA